jgi:hypothetical protein
MFITICSQIFSPYEGGGAMVKTLLLKVEVVQMGKYINN